MFLLSTQAFADLIRGTDAPMMQWASSFPSHRILVSVLSIATILDRVRSLEAQRKVVWEKRIQLAKRQYSNSALSITLDIAEVWSDILSLGLVDPNAAGSLPSESELLVIATAVARQLVFIDRRNAFHDVLRAQYQLEIFDPYGSE